MRKFKWFNWHTAATGLLDTNLNVLHTSTMVNSFIVTLKLWDNLLIFVGDKG